MKKCFLGIVLSCLLTCGLQAQKIIDNWAFSTGEDVTLWMNLGGEDSTILEGNDLVSGRSGLIDIGFPFQFGESTHTKFSTNVNGTIRLGNTQIPASGNIDNPLSTDMANGPKVEPFGMRGRFRSDCYTTTALLGDSGSRVRVIETRMSGYYWNASGNVSFQVQLFETGGLRIVYGVTNNYNAGFTGSGTQVGLATTTGSPSYNKDVIFIDMVNHQEVRFDGNCTRRNPDGVWVAEGRWYMLAPDSNVCPYPPAVTAMGTNPASITFANSYGGAADLHIRIPSAGLDTLWARTQNYLTLDSLFNAKTTYTGTVQSVCDSSHRSYRTRSFSFTTGCGEVRHLPWTDGFQSTDCWDVSRYTATNNKWKPSGGAMRSGATTEQNYDEWLVSPIIHLPIEEGIVLQWTYNAAALNGVSPHVDVRVAPCDGDGTVDSADWTTLLTLDTTYDSGSQLRLTLDSLGGQRIKIAFVRTGTGGQFAFVDNVQLFLNQIPVISLVAPEMVFVGDTAVFSCSIVDGIAEGLLWEWHSSLTDEWGSDSSLWVLSYYGEGGGMDTVTVIVSNAYGADTATAIVHVVDCSATIPWEENFEESSGLTFQNDCWIVNGWNHRSQVSLLDERDEVTTYTHLMLSTVVGKYMLTPDFVIPTTNLDNLKFWVQCAADDLLVRLSPTGDTAIASFTDTLMVIHGDRQHMRWFLADLSPYAGQTVRMGIFSMAGNQPWVNAVKVDYDLEPVLGKIEGSDVVFTGDTVTFQTTSLRGATPIIYYPWNSTLNSQGGVQYMSYSSDGDAVTIAYAVGGYDTLTAIAFNNYGEDTVTKIVHVVDCQPITSLPWTEDFGDSRLCWYVPYGSQWGYGTTNGIHYLQNSPDANLSDSWLISPAITIPADPDEYVRFFWKVARNYNTDPHYYQVLVSDDFDYTNTAYYTVLYSDSAVHPILPYYDYLSVPLSTYAGQTIHIAFHHLSANNSTSHIMFLTGAEVRSAKMPRIGSVVAPADHYTEDGSLQATALLSEGSRFGLCYTWHSSLLDSTMVTIDSTVVINYSVGGVDTLSVIASNAYGADTAWVVVNVHHCPATTLPFREPFKNDSTLGCWHRWNFNTASALSGWRIREAYGSVSYYPVMMAGNYNNHANAWLLSPTIDIPAATSGLNLKVKVFGAPPSGLTILASTTGRADTSLYTDTLYHDYPSQQWQQLSLPLNDFAGQQVSFAFVHTGTTYYDYGIELDSLAIDYDTLPQVTLTHSIVTLGDTTWFYASLNNCISTGLFYLWHSTLTGQSVVGGSQWPVVYTSGGIDTVTLIVSNLYAADTVTMLVRVIDCSPKAIPWEEDFEGVPAVSWTAVGQLPSCWDSLWNGSGAALAPHIIGTGGYNFISNIPDNTLFMIGGSGGGYDSVALVTLPRMADSLQRLSIAFDYRFEDTTRGTLQAGYLDGTSFVPLQTMTPHSGSYRRDTVSLAAATLPDARIALRWLQGYIYYAVVIDNIEVFVDGTLPAPAVTVDSVETTTALLSWSAMAGATGYHVEVVGLLDTTLIVDTFHLSALTPGTTYTVHVTALAGVEVGHTATVQFSTPCIVLHLPYSTDFSGVAAGTLPTCWNYQWGGAVEHAPQVTAGGFLQLLTNFSDISGYAPQSYVTLPVVDDTLAHYALALQHQTSTVFTGYARVGYMRGSNFVTLANLPLNSAATANTVFHDTVWLYGVPDNVNQLTICSVKTGGLESDNVLNIYELSIFVDTVIHAPTGLHADSVSAGCVWLSWDSVRNASAYHVTIDGVTDTVVAATACMLCGLEASTTYTVQVAGIEGSDTGVYSQTSFTTACGTIALPYFEDFESYTSVPQCWFYVGSGYDNFVNGDWEDYCHSGSHAMRLQIGTFGHGRQFATPLIDVPADGLQVSFWTRYPGILGDTLLAGVMTDPDDESSFIPLQRIFPTDTYTLHTFDTRGVSADRVRVAFRHKGQVSVAYIMIDDIRIDSLRMRTLSLFSDNSAMGTVSGGGTYVDSSQVSISATPFEGFHFTNWSDGDTHAIRTLLLVSDTTLVAYFESDVPDTVWRTVTVNPVMYDGSDEPMLVDMVSGAGTYIDGATVTLEGEVNGCSLSFVFWVTAEGDTLTDNPYTFVVTSDVTITAVFAWFGGVEEIENSKLKIDIYPNPAHGDVTVRLNDEFRNDDVWLEVIDMTGRTVIPPTPVSSSYIIHHSSLPSGTYFVKVSTKRGSTVRKLIIK